MKRALIGAAYLISGAIFICFTNDQIMLMLGLVLGFSGLVITIVELFRNNYK